MAAPTRWHNYHMSEFILMIENIGPETKMLSFPPLEVVQECARRLIAIEELFYTGLKLLHKGRIEISLSDFNNI